MSTPRKYTDKERAILQIVQKNLPDSETPFADIAKATNSTEEEVLNLLREMKESGAIRRFGASLKHQRAGYTHNAMVAWIVDRDKVDEMGEKAAEHRMISHCYFRPSDAEDWPYELYTMIHGQKEGDCEAIIEELKKLPGFDEYAILESIKELKKTSMVYF